MGIRTGSCPRRAPVHKTQKKKRGVRALIGCERLFLQSACDNLTGFGIVIILLTHGARKVG